MISKWFKERLRKFIISCMKDEVKTYHSGEQILATLESVQFLKESVNECPVFYNKFELLESALKIASEVFKKDGMYLEFGVFKGETINYIAKIVKDREIYGFDCFKGLPEDWRKGFEKGVFCLNELPDVRENVCLIEGYFENSIPEFLKENAGKVAFIHVDCDLYSSTRCVFDNLHKWITKGSVIVFDEFLNYPGWQEGEFKAWNEFATQNSISYKYIGYVDGGEQLAVQVR